MLALGGSESRRRGMDIDWSVVEYLSGYDMLF